MGDAGCRPSTATTARGWCATRTTIEWIQGNQIPRMGGDGPETDWWVYEDFAWCHQMLNACAGYREDEWWMGPIGFDQMRPGCYDPKARVADMDLNHIEASLCFPTYPRFCGQLFAERDDKELAFACVRAYNDWMVEEWAGDSGGRLVPLQIVPLWDPQLAADEIRRNAARGVHAVAFSELPGKLGLPTIHDPGGHWEPFFAACNETDTAIFMHIGSGSHWLTSSPDAPPAVTANLVFLTSAMALSDWLFSGVLARYPNLRVCFAEGQIGWIPYVAERADVLWSKSGAGPGTAARSSARTAEPLPAPGVRLLLRRPGRPGPARHRSVSTRSCSRRTIRTKTAPGRTPSTPSRRSPICSPTWNSRRSSAATPRRLLRL